MNRALTWSLVGAVFATMATVSAQASSDDDYIPREAGDILPFEQILERARAQVPGVMLEADLERKQGHYVYEVEMLSEDGRHHELHFDAKTGGLLHKE